METLEKQYECNNCGCDILINEVDVDISEQECYNCGEIGDFSLIKSKEIDH